jgi:hypothetical protein
MDKNNMHLSVISNKVKESKENSKNGSQLTDSINKKEIISS